MPEQFFILSDGVTVDYGVAPDGATIIDNRGERPFWRRQFTAVALATVIALHAAWWRGGEVEGPEAVRARLDGARLDGARLVRASLVDASLVDASLVGARLDGARLDGASLVDASLVGARLDGASLVGARLDGARLDGASLVRARLVGARLDGARLVGARLDGASLVGARLVGARLDGARLDGASLVGASLVDSRRWEEYRQDHLVGICGAPDVVAKAADAWGGHSWDSCPMHAALGVASADQAGEKALLVACWVALFDARLLESPRVIALRRMAPELHAAIASGDMARIREVSALAFPFGAPTDAERSCS